MSVPRYHQHHSPNREQGYPPYQPKYPPVYGRSPQQQYPYGGGAQHTPQYHPTMPPPPVRQPPPMMVPSQQYRKEYHRRPIPQPDPEIYRRLLDSSYKRKQEDSSPAERQKKQRVDDSVLFDNRDDDNTFGLATASDNIHEDIDTIPEDDPWAHLVCFEQEGKPGVPDPTDPIWQPPLEDVSDWQPVGPPES